MIRLEEKVRQAAVAPVLLVACDFDGTLAPIVSHPSQARPDPRAMASLERLAAMPHTFGAIISGRALGDLSGVVRVSDRMMLVGSHGAEFDESFRTMLPPASVDLLARVRGEVSRLTHGIAGVFIEDKPASIALHWRNADEARIGPVMDEILAGPAGWDGVHVRPGLKVLELSVAPGDKGRALNKLRHTTGAAMVVFLGDDTTDEDAFGVMASADLSVKIGGGSSRAAYRLESHEQVAELLVQIAERRAEWLDSRRLVPIEGHSILSDQRTAAVVDPEGRVVWLCLPRIDSGAVFAELLGGPSRGRWEVIPAARCGPPKQRYVGDSLVLETRWETITLTDYFDCSGGRPFQRAGRSDLVRVIEGTGEVIIRFAPRIDYGRVSTRLALRENGLEVEGSPDPIVLYSPGVTWRIHEEGIHQAAEATVALSGEPLVMELRYGSANLRAAVLPQADRFKQSERFWSGWSATLKPTQVRPDLVKRSAVLIKALCQGPTGAIAAAATTSLPEQLGGVRNWDYRYCWPRDASLSAAALLRLGNTGTAMKLLDWLGQVVFNCESPDRLRPIYDVAGRELGPEAEIGDLPGYGGSRPVRVGNGAASQVQLDVFGPIVDLVAMLAERGAPVTPESWRLVAAMVEAVQLRWQEPDHGIWEIRGPRRHHVHSKVMCWHAVDRALVVADNVLGRTKPEWVALRDEIHADVMAKGWDEGVGAFTGVYGASCLDAAVLHMALVGMLPATDPRLLSTIDRIDAGLRKGPVVYRYKMDDGLPGIEGGLQICTFWLVEALALCGRVTEARALFDAAVELAGPTGILTEEFEPDLKLSLGNFPQAYSHLGLINAAVRLSQTPPA